MTGWKLKALEMTIKTVLLVILVGTLKNHIYSFDLFIVAVIMMKIRTQFISCYPEYFQYMRAK